MQDLLAEDGTGSCYNHRNGRYQYRTIEDIIPHFFQIICSEILGHRYSKARTAPHTETKHQKLHTAAGSHTGQRLCSKDLPYNSRINDVIGLLQQISNEKRQCKLKHQLQRIAFYHRC